MRRSFLTLAAAAVFALFTTAEASACHKSCCQPACPPPCPPPVVCYVPPPCPPPVCAPVCAPKHCFSMPKFHMPKFHCKPACAPAPCAPTYSYAYAPVAAPVYATGQGYSTPQR
jgi:hypothetical protein